MAAVPGTVDVVAQSEPEHTPVTIPKSPEEPQELPAEEKGQSNPETVAGHEEVADPPAEQPSQQTTTASAEPSPRPAAGRRASNQARIMQEPNQDTSSASVLGETTAQSLITTSASVPLNDPTKEASSNSWLFGAATFAVILVALIARMRLAYDSDGR